MGGSLEHLNKLDNVWMVDIFENAHFVVSQLGQFGNAFEFLKRHGFDSEKGLGFLVCGFVDISVLTFADLL